LNPYGISPSLSLAPSYGLPLNYGSVYTPQVTPIVAQPGIISSYQPSLISPYQTGVVSSLQPTILLDENDEPKTEAKPVSSRRMNSNVQSGIQQFGQGNMNLQGNIQQVGRRQSQVQYQQRSQ
jgi:hypothetical protein